jgi:hypothetical protein
VESPEAAFGALTEVSGHGENGCSLFGNELGAWACSLLKEGTFPPKDTAIASYCEEASALKGPGLLCRQGSVVHFGRGGVGGEEAKREGAFKRICSYAAAANDHFRHGEKIT